MKKQLLALCCLGALLVADRSADACSRVLYQGPDGMIVTGRNMDWSEDLHTNLRIFPRGIARRGANHRNTLQWESKYGSVAVTNYDMGVSDGMNEAGLVANSLFLPESVYTRERDDRPVMGLSIWVQYILDNFATVNEAVSELAQERFRIDAPDLPGGKKTRVHLALSDASGDSAILEYIDGRLEIHHGRQYQVLTNSPVYDQQLAINDYWQQIGGLKMLPGTNRSSDRFARASFYINAVHPNADPKVAVPTVLSVMRNVAVPYGITTPDQPYISSTRWSSVFDQKNRIFYFVPTLSMEAMWIDFQQVDFSKGRPERVLTLTDGKTRAGNVSAQFQATDRPFVFFMGI